QAALELVNLTEFAHRKADQLSGGQQQRVALARALVLQPHVLLLDEPLGALDAKLRKNLQVELKALQSELGITFVFVTHDQEEALTMSDRIAVMNHGRVEQLGTPEELYDRPMTRFVADFIGTTNLLSGTVEGSDPGTVRVRLDSGDVCVVAASGIGIGRSVEVSVRPEAVAIRTANGGSPTPAPINATVEQVAYLGGNVQYIVRTSGGLSITALASKAGDRIPVGGAVAVTWLPGDALVLAGRSDDQEEIRA
ncbi:MAG: ABC transporter ATP-binding protein, partial [Actinomycetota bacterium]